MASEKNKSLIEAYLLYLTLGLFGAHHFYLNRFGWGVLYFLTCGLIGVGYIIDLFRMPFLVKMANERGPDETDEINLHDAYVLWLPFGLLGFHHFYFDNRKLGYIYLCSFGLFGIGWIRDLFLIPKYVRDKKSGEYDPEDISTIIGMACAITPVGIFGCHHFYLNRNYFGKYYLFSFGLLGVGYIIDWFRMPHLMKRYSENQMSQNTLYVDDVYVLWFPLGLFGFHHFYLKRRCWGLLYFFTFGIYGIGWLIDLYRIPRMVKDFNESRKKYKKPSIFNISQGEQVATGNGRQTLGSRTTEVSLNIETPTAPPLDEVSLYCGYIAPEDFQDFGRHLARPPPYSET